MVVPSFLQGNTSCGELNLDMGEPDLGVRGPIQGKLDVDGRHCRASVGLVCVFEGHHVKDCHSSRSPIEEVRWLCTSKQR